MSADKARTLGHWCAVEPDSQGEQNINGVILSLDSRYRRNFLIGKVLCVGPKAKAYLSVGSRVVYERESGHPSQTGPIDAALFGGEEGRFAVILPLYPSALDSVADLEEELLKRKADVEKMGAKADSVGLTESDFDQLAVHEIKIKYLEDRRTGRARGVTRRKIADGAKGSGIVAILED